mmetsp:Transcript_28226/g.63010  ORF Transcript_28226/g.63010 Transcript_28226/m.63010 type:complete len:398 (+) Transcript_28226:141-1334(+)
MGRRKPHFDTSRVRGLQRRQLPLQRIDHPRRNPGRSLWSPPLAHGGDQPRGGGESLRSAARCEHQGQGPPPAARLPRLLQGVPVQGHALQQRGSPDRRDRVPVVGRLRGFARRPRGDNTRGRGGRGRSGGGTFPDGAGARGERRGVQAVEGRHQGRAQGRRERALRQGVHPRAGERGPLQGHALEPLLCVRGHGGGRRRERPRGKPGGQDRLLPPRAPPDRGTGEGPGLFLRRGLARVDRGEGLARGEGLRRQAPRLGQDPPGTPGPARVHPVPWRPERRAGLEAGGHQGPRVHPDGRRRERWGGLLRVRANSRPEGVQKEVPKVAGLTPDFLDPGGPDGCRGELRVRPQHGALQGARPQGGLHGPRPAESPRTPPRQSRRRRRRRRRRRKSGTLVC